MAPKKSKRAKAKKAIKKLKAKSIFKRKGKNVDPEVRAAAQGAKKGKKKGKKRGMFKAYGAKFKDKMMSKGKLMEKKLKERAHDMKGKMKEKGNELRKKMREKMENATTEDDHDDDDHKSKKKRKKKHGSGGSMGAVVDKLEQWRRPFEKRGWAQGKVLHDWATITLLGLNAFSGFLALPVFGTTLWVAWRFHKDCLTFFLGPAVAVGFFFSLVLVIVSAAGFIGVWFNRLGLVKLHFWCTTAVVLVLFTFTVFGFLLTARGKGATVEKGIKLRQYNLKDYTKEFRFLVTKPAHWSVIKACILSKGLCKNIAKYSSAAEFYDAKLTAIQSGCCIPPFSCGFAYDGMVWKSSTNGEVEKDCARWKDDQLCLNCDACKAAYLQDVKRRWLKSSIVSIVVIFALVIILLRTWFVMRIAGRWDPISETMTNTLKAATGGAESEAEEEVFVPTFLEADGTILEDQLGSADVEKKKKKKKKKKESILSSFKKKKKKEAGATEDGAWQGDQSVGAFPEGFLAQNPLTTISPWQTPDPTAVAGYNVDPYGYQQYSPQQQYGQDSYGYTDPYGQQVYQDPNQAYDDPNQWQDPSYYQDPNQGYYQDQQGYYQDPYQGYGYDQYGQPQAYVDPNQGYMVDPNQGYMVDPNQGYVDPNQGYVDPNQGYVDPNQGYVDPNQGYGYGPSPGYAPPGYPPPPGGYPSSEPVYTPSGYAPPPGYLPQY